MNECDHYRNLEEAGDDGIPAWVDEDAHLDDYNADCIFYIEDAQEQYEWEYRELRSLGLSHKQALKVMENE